MENALNLQLFADGDGAASGGESGAQAAAVQESAHNITQNRNGRTSALANVQYGTVATKTDAQQDVNEEPLMPESQPVDPVDKAKAFEEIIKGEYKAEFDKRVQSIINERFKSAKGTEEKLAKLEPILDLMGRKYGVASDDIETLSKAIQDDDSYYETEAMEKGLTIEQLKQFKQMERENAELKRVNEEREKIEQSQRIYAEWMRQSEQMKTLYPNFDLRAEINNPSFMKILKVPGMDVRTAFEVAHRDELIAPAMQHTAQQVSQAIVNNIRSKGARPAENGVQTRASAVVKNDVTKLTKEDRREIYRRVVERGEKITFN